jgi:hypothetical protein
MVSKIPTVCEVNESQLLVVSERIDLVQDLPEPNSGLKKHSVPFVAFTDAKEQHFEQIIRFVISCADNLRHGFSNKRVKLKARAVR